MITILTKRSLCCKKYNFDVSSSLYLENDAEAALIRFLISVVSWYFRTQIISEH